MILTHGTGIYRKRRMQRKQREEGHDLHDMELPRSLGGIRESVGQSVERLAGRVGWKLELELELDSRHD
jgi:hypothetical protein